MTLRPHGIKELFDRPVEPRPANRSERTRSLREVAPLAAGGLSGKGSEIECRTSLAFVMVHLLTDSLADLPHLSKTRWFPGGRRQRSRSRPRGYRGTGSAFPRVETLADRQPFACPDRAESPESAWPWLAATPAGVRAGEPDPWPDPRPYGCATLHTAWPAAGENRRDGRSATKKYAGAHETLD